MSDEVYARVVELSPQRRIGTPLDSALVTLFQTSEAAGWLTGITLDVTAG